MSSINTPQNTPQTGPTHRLDSHASPSNNPSKIKGDIHTDSPTTEVTSIFRKSAPLAKKSIKNPFYNVNKKEYTKRFQPYTDKLHRTGISLRQPFLFKIKIAFFRILEGLGWKPVKGSSVSDRIEKWKQNLANDYETLIGDYQTDKAYFDSHNHYLENLTASEGPISQSLKEHINTVKSLAKRLIKKIDDSKEALLKPFKGQIRAINLDIEKLLNIPPTEETEKSSEIDRIRREIEGLSTEMNKVEKNNGVKEVETLKAIHLEAIEQLKENLIWRHVPQEVRNKMKGHKKSMDANFEFVYKAFNESGKELLQKDLNVDLGAISDDLVEQFKRDIPRGHSFLIKDGDKINDLSPVPSSNIQDGAMRIQEGARAINKVEIGDTQLIWKHILQTAVTQRTTNSCLDAINVVNNCALGNDVSWTDSLGNDRSIKYDRSQVSPIHLEIIRDSNNQISEVQVKTKGSLDLINFVTQGPKDTIILEPEAIKGSLKYVITLTPEGNPQISDLSLQLTKSD